MAVYHCVFLGSVWVLLLKNACLHKCASVFFIYLFIFTVFSQQEQMILIFTVFVLVSTGSYVIIQIVLCAESVRFEFWQKCDPTIPLVDNVSFH